MPLLPLTTSYWPADPSRVLLETTIGGVLRTAAARAPDQVALIAGAADPALRRQWTYAGLLAEAERAGRALLARFAPGERVAVWAGNRPDWVLLEFAAGLAGLTLVTVNPAYQAEELAHVLGHSGARGLFLADEYRGSLLPAILAQVRDRLPGLRDVIPFGEWDAFCASGDGERLPEFDGSVGEPARQARRQRLVPRIRGHHPLGVWAEGDEQPPGIGVPAGRGHVGEKRDPLGVADHVQDVDQAPHDRLGQRLLRPRHGHSPLAVQRVREEQYQQLDVLR